MVKFGPDPSDFKHSNTGVRRNTPTTTKVKIFSEYDRDFNHQARQRLEDEINQFGETHEIVSVSICSELYVGISHAYTAAVTYKEE